MFMIKIYSIITGKVLCNESLGLDLSPMTRLRDKILDEYRSVGRGVPVNPFYNL